MTLLDSMKLTKQEEQELKELMKLPRQSRNEAIMQFLAQCRATRRLAVVYSTRGNKGEQQ